MIEPMIITVTAIALTQARFDRPSLGAWDRVQSHGQAMPCQLSCGRRIGEPARKRTRWDALLGLIVLIFVCLALTSVPAGTVGVAR
jgi:hypothetical protein